MQDNYNAVGVATALWCPSLSGGTRILQGMLQLADEMYAHSLLLPAILQGTQLRCTWRKGLPTALPATLCCLIHYALGYISYFVRLLAHVTWMEHLPSSEMLRSTVPAGAASYGLNKAQPSMHKSLFCLIPWNFLDKRYACTPVRGGAGLACETFTGLESNTRKVIGCCEI